jgi:hypothetical protein
MPDTCPSTVSSWVSFLTPLATFFLGSITAVFSDPVRKRIFRPKIELTFNNDSDHVANTPDRESGREYFAHYIRLGVKNKNTTLAKQCRAYLVNIEKKEDGDFKRTIYADSIQLAWSCRGKGNELTPIDLPKGISQYVDLIATTSKDNSYKPQTIPFMFRVIRCLVLLYGVKGGLLRPQRTSPIATQAAERPRRPWVIGTWGR